MAAAVSWNSLYAIGLCLFGFGLNFFPMNGLGAVTQILTARTSSPTMVPFPGLGQQFSLELGQVTRIPDTGLTLKFQSLVADSRCPVGAQCIWAGEAKILLEVETITQSVSSLELTLRPGLETETPLSPFQIQLLSLAPYPGKSTPQAPIATLIVK